jgi:NADPH-dependent 2,4-dienoyl-CoA reductase/sulfur reductase-like enzyme
LDLSDASQIVLIGGGQAAAQAVQSLRMGGYTGKLVLVGDEPALPYQRPPLSKAYMKGEFAEERLFFKPAAWYEDNGVELILSTPRHEDRPRRADCRTRTWRDAELRRADPVHRLPSAPAAREGRRP